MGKQGEIEAFVYRKALGYRFVASNFRVPAYRGEIDLIGRGGEVKTLSDDSFAPPSTAVNQSKQQHILSVAKLTCVVSGQNLIVASTYSASFRRVPTERCN